MTDGGDQSQKISATFEVAPDAEIGILHVDKFDIDATNSIIRRRAVAPR